jgi:DNA-directed RNA polymerase subunit M/transcription elongation factor TFIIS
MEDKKKEIAKKFNILIPNSGEKISTYIISKCYEELKNETECNYKNRKFINYINSKTNITLELLNKESLYYSKTFSKKIIELLNDKSIIWNNNIYKKIPYTFKDQNIEFWKFYVEKNNNNDNDGIRANCNEQCWECKTRNVTYRSEQQRSADEGMTAIFTCNDCDNVWKK